MEYRTLKNNLSLNLSTLAINGISLNALSEKEIKDFLDNAKSNGLNIIDLFMTEQWSRKSIGKALKDYRKDFFVIAHLGSIFQKEQYKISRSIDEVSDSLEDLLNDMQTDYVDFGIIHNIETLEDWNTICNDGFFEYCLGLKDYGKIKNLGISTQNLQVAKAIIETKDIDVIMLPVNLFYDIDFGIEKDINILFNNHNLSTQNMSFDTNKFEIYSLCQKKGVGIFATEIFGEGALLFDRTSPFKKALSVDECIKYSLDRLGVVSALIDFNDLEQMKQILKYYDETYFDKDYVRVLANYNLTFDNCLYCNNCLPCPKNIDIGKVLKAIDLLNDDEVLNEEFLTMAKKCNACGKCEINCPFGVNVIEKLKNMAR